MIRNVLFLTLLLLLLVAAAAGRGKTIKRGGSAAATTATTTKTSATSATTTLTDSDGAAAAAAAATVAGVASEQAAAAAGGARCFRGFQLRRRYQYQWKSNARLHKLGNDGWQDYEHEREYTYNVRASLLPVVVDSHGLMHVEMRVDEAKLRDVEGYGAYSQDKSDVASESETNRAFLAALRSGHFSFSIACDGHVVAVAHAATDDESLVNIKIGLARSFSHTVRSTMEYTVNEADHLGDRHVRYERQAAAVEAASGDVVVRLAATHDDDRPVRFHSSDLAHLHATADATDRMKRTIEYRNGVLHRVEYDDALHFPALQKGGGVRRLATVRPPAGVDDDGSAVHAAGKYEMHAYGNGHLQLTDVSEDDGAHERLQAAVSVAAAAERKRDGAATTMTTNVRNQDHFLRLYLGEVAAAEVRRAPPHLQSTAPTKLSEAEEDAAYDDDGALPDLALLLRNLRHPETGMQQWARLRRALQLYPSLLDDEHNAYEFIGQHSSLSDVEKMDFLTAVAKMDGRHRQQSERFLLRALDDTTLSEDMRVKVLFAIDSASSPSNEFLDAIEAYLEYEQELSGLGKQAALVLGSMANTMHHLGDLQRAHTLREILYDHLRHAPRLLDSHIFAIALNNSLINCGDLSKDERMSNVTYGLPMRHYERHQSAKVAAFRAAHAAARKRGGLPECNGQYHYTPSYSVSCKSLNYFNVRPDPALALFGWEKVLGKDGSKFYAKISFVLDWYYNSTGLEDFHMRFFVGGGLACFIWNKWQIELAAAYARLEAFIEMENSTCAVFEAGVYYGYLMRVFYWGVSIRFECMDVESTCYPYVPPDHAVTYITFKRIEFLEDIIPPIRFMVGPVPCSLVIGAFGEVGMYYTVQMIRAEGKGGLALLGYVAPTGKIGVYAELAIDLFVLRVGLGIELTLVEVTVPVSLGYNLLTRRVCMYFGMKVGALGGKVYVFVELKLLFIKKKWTFVIFQWKGLVWEKAFVDKDCCIQCETPCMNAWCNYRDGTCVCNADWGGPGCQISCPKDCIDIDLINPRVQCNDTDHLYTDDCLCYYGYMGWDCTLECPGMPDESYRGHPCWDMGICNSYAKCSCFYDYFDIDCNKTCNITGPVEPHLEGVSDGSRCGFYNSTGGYERNGACIFRFGEARCACYKGYSGDHCEIGCEKVNDMPCAFRGQCFRDDPSDTVGHCHCELGFFGEKCQEMSYKSSFRAIQFDGYGKAVVAASGSLQSARASYTTCAWFNATTFAHVNSTDARLIHWRWGSMRLKETGEFHVCSQAEGDCYELDGGDGVVSALQWHYFCVNVNSFQVAHDVQVWLLPNANSAQKFKSFHKNVDWLYIADKLTIGEHFVGTMDEIRIFNSAPTNTLVEFWRTHIVSPQEVDLLFYLRCDEGLGKVLYDETGMITAIGEGTKYKYVASDVDLENGRIYSNEDNTRTIPIAHPGNETLQIEYRMDLNGRLIADTTGVFYKFMFEVPPPLLCRIKIEFVRYKPFPHDERKPESPSNKPDVVFSKIILDDFFGGVGWHTVALTGDLATVVPQIKDGPNYLVFHDPEGECPYTLTEHYLMADAPALDATVESSRGDPWHYAELVGNPPVLTTPWVFEGWFERPDHVNTHAGILVAVVPDGFNHYEDNLFAPEIFKIYETGGGLGIPNSHPYAEWYKGVQAWHEASGNNSGNFYDYETPIGRWFHLAVTCDAACNVQVFVNGLPAMVENNDGYFEATQHWTAGTCTTVRGMTGTAGYKVQFMPGFLGKMNNVRWSSGTTITPIEDYVLPNMYLRVTNSAFGSATGVVMAFTFDDREPNDPTTVVSVVSPIINHKSGGANLIMQSGIFRGNLQSNTHAWKYCKGITFNEPEAICNSDWEYSRGVCYKINPYEITTNCECLPGFMGPECMDECPGAPEENVCASHGVCVSQNNTGVCICDPGYVGDVCDLECPDYTADYNIPRRICSGRGRCFGNTSTGAVCACDDDCGCYGDACQFIQGMEPVAIVSGCEGCDGSGEECVDGACTCVEGTYRVFTSCLPSKNLNGAMHDRALSMLLLVVVIVCQLFL